MRHKDENRKQGETMHNNSLILQMKIAFTHSINISMCRRKESGGVGGAAAGEKKRLFPLQLMVSSVIPESRRCHLSLSWARRGPISPSWHPSRHETPDFLHRDAAKRPTSGERLFNVRHADARSHTGELWREKKSSNNIIIKRPA